MSSGGKREGAGRKKGVPNKATADVRELARKYGPDSMEELARLEKKPPTRQSFGLHRSFLICS